MTPTYIYQVVKNGTVIIQTLVYEWAENLAKQYNTDIYVYRLTKIKTPKASNERSNNE